MTKRSLANRSGAKSAATKHFPAPPPRRSEAAPLVDQPSAEPVSTTLEGQPEPRLCPVSRRYGAPISPVASERQSALWQLWRLIGMPIFYPLFAVGCCVGLLGAAGIRLVVRVPAARVRANRRLLSAISRQWLRFGCWLRLLEWEALRPAGSDAATVKTTDAAPGDQTPGRLLVANHPTLIDILFMVSLEPELCCVLKADLNDHWVFALFIRELDYLSNADPERLLAEGAERLLSGETLLVFPEGTRTVPGQSVSFRQGAAALAVRAGLPVQPVVIEYQGAYLSKGFPWYALPKQRLRYRFRFGGPLHGRPTASGDTTAARSARRQARRQLNATLEQFMNQQLLASTLPAPSRTGMSSEQPLTPLRGADL
ncbi:MAG: lysophospholipid acyltransferase family protein [Pseudomonadota bacterium]